MKKYKALLKEMKQTWVIVRAEYDSKEDAVTETRIKTFTDYNTSIDWFEKNAKGKPYQLYYKDDDYTVSVIVETQEYRNEHRKIKKD